MIPVPEEGALWGCRVNAHRDNWAGHDCHDPVGWECGSQASFREYYCARGARRCYHVSLFEPKEPHFIIEEKGGWLFAEDRHAWDGQVILIYSFRAREPFGKQSDGAHAVVGFYVVERVREQHLSHSTVWHVEPRLLHRIDDVQIPIDARDVERVGRPYLVHIPARVVRRVLDQWEQRTTSERDRRFIEALRSQHIPESARQNRLVIERNRIEYRDDQDFSNSPFAALSTLAPTRVWSPAATHESRIAHNESPAVPIDDDEAGEVAEMVEAATAVNEVADDEVEVDTALPEQESAVAPERPSLLRRDVLEPLRSDYTADTLDALWLGTLRPNALVILRGAPGIGKSRLATALLPQARMFLQTVSSTWRGREDLLGYANPVSGRFVPTPFARFLADTARAWRDGDREPFLVVLEEFNISAPEHWFSDLLVLSQYPDDALELRTLRLPGGAPDDSWRGNADHTQIFLSPALRFVATINTDHTTQPLSPRVLDRAALVSVTASVDTILHTAGLPAFESDVVDAIKSLAESFRPYGAHFSRRTALALSSAIDAGREHGLDDIWNVLDLVLVSQLLGGVRIYAGRLEALTDLEEIAAQWEEVYGGRLPRCYTLLEEWLELLRAGRDVVQA